MSDMFYGQQINLEAFVRTALLPCDWKVTGLYINYDGEI